MSGITTSRLPRIDATVMDQLCDLLIDCVAGGTTVSFMWPMTRDKAETFWRAVDAGLRVVSNLCIRTEHERLKIPSKRPADSEPF